MPKMIKMISPNHRTQNLKKLNDTSRMCASRVDVTFQTFSALLALNPVPAHMAPKGSDMEIVQQLSWGSNAQQCADLEAAVADLRFMVREQRSFYRLWTCEQSSWHPTYDISTIMAVEVEFSALISSYSNSPLFFFFSMNVDLGFCLQMSSGPSIRCSSQC